LKTLAIIGGTGLNQFDDFDHIQEHVKIQTDLGSPSSSIIEGRLGNVRLLFLPRHGASHSIAPHLINYRANLLALQQLGADEIIAINAVGGINKSAVAGHICIPDQIIDYTSSREQTFFDGIYKPLDHIDFTYPYSEPLRQKIIQTVLKQPPVAGFSVVGVYAATQGPRLETIAEIKKLESDGCDLVGMTGMPEAALARELNIPYASICLVVNPAAGKSDGIIEIDQIRLVLEQGMEVIKNIIHGICARDQHK
jgi:5'-methylthioinosine phosphorylase